MHSIPIIVSLVVTLGGSAPTPPDEPAFIHAQTQAYRQHEIRGFTVLVSPAAVKHAQTTDPALELLEEKLARVVAVTPAHTHEALRKIRFWIEHENPGFPCACYHPSGQWLTGNGYNADKADGIEIANPANFVAWASDQPEMVLHELAHAYHDTVLGYDHPLIIETYQSAVESGSYDQVEHINGARRKAYALNDPQEYFAELTEAYFGTNDFAPFTRDELRAFDPDGFAMIEELWLRPVVEE